MNRKPALIRLCALLLLITSLSVSPQGTWADDDEKTPAKSEIADRLTVFGRVLNADTGEPVTKFIIQGGRFDPKNPGEHTWGYSVRRSRSERFSGTKAGRPASWPMDISRNQSLQSPRQGRTEST